MTASLPEFYADGKTYEVEMRRQDNKMKLEVTEDVQNGASDDVLVTGPESSKQLNLGTNPDIHIGGIPKDSAYYGYALTTDNVGFIAVHYFYLLMNFLSRIIVDIQFMNIYMRSRMQKN